MTKKLLLAEDSLTIQKVFSLTFEQSDISLTTVDNGEDAVRLAEEISPDLVVADVTLADRDGFEVAAALRAAESTRSCPILILAGSLPPFDEEKFRQSGADAVLFKPFESQELIDKVDTLLRGGDVPMEAKAGEAEAAGGEAWDFSDVLQEVEEETGMPDLSAHTAAALLPEEIGGAASRGDEPRSLGEFDVSLEEITGEAADFGPPPEETPGAEGNTIAEAAGEEPAGGETEDFLEELPSLDLHAEDLGLEEASLIGEEPPPLGEDQPPAGEDPPSAGGEPPLPEDTGVGAGEPDRTGPEQPADEAPAEYGPAVEVPLEKMPEGLLEPAPFVPADPFVAKLTAVPEGPVAREEHEVAEDATPEEIVAPGDDRVREEFTDRVRAILETVAAETVEKILWEMMERLSGDIRQQIREAVESVAWDVIPATAESLIREEIERIRGKTGE